MSAITMLASLVGEATPSFDYYLKPGGSGDGSAWNNSFGSFAAAAAAAPDESRVWVAPGTYTISTTVAYADKAISWVAPPRCGGQLVGHLGNVYITGAPTGRFFDVSGTAEGGGFYGFCFNLANGTDQLIRMSGQQNFTVEDCYSRGTDNKVTHERPILQVVGSDNVDGLRFIDNDTHSGYLLWAHTMTAGTSAKHWVVNGNFSQKACSSSDQACFFDNPTVRLVGADFDGLVMFGGYLETNKSPTVLVDMTGVSGPRRITVATTGERDAAPTHQFTNCRINIMWPGGVSGNSNGSFSGTNTVEGYVAVPNARLFGDLVAGVN